MKLLLTTKTKNIIIKGIKINISPKADKDTISDDKPLTIAEIINWQLPKIALAKPTLISNEPTAHAKILAEFIRAPIDIRNIKNKIEKALVHCK